MRKKLTRVSIAAFCLALLLSIVGCAGAAGGPLTMSAPPAPGAAPEAAGWAMADGAMPAPAASAPGLLGGWDGAVVSESEDMAMLESQVSAPNEGAGGQVPPLPQARGRMIIYTAHVSLQTLEFDAGVSALEQMAHQMGGFIQSSSISGRNLHDRGGWQHSRFASYTMRIPQTRLNEFLTGLDNRFNVSSSSLSSDDITMHFFDTQARLDSLRVQQERLLDMLGRAEDIEFLLQVERELARVGWEIESLTSALNRMDDSVSYATVHVSLEEVIEYTEFLPVATSFGEQAGRAFSGAWRGFGASIRGAALFMISATPQLILLLVLAAVGLAVYRARKRKAESRRQMTDGK